MIPKIIHYCWYGGNPKPKRIKKCINSWKTHLPEYKIMCWDESNTDLDIPFIKEAYLEKKWAYVSDYIRLKALYEYGGIYLDTDMLVLKNLDTLLVNQCFFGIGDPKYIYTGIIGAKKSYSFLWRCLKDYEAFDDFPVDVLPEITSPKIVTKCFREYYNYTDTFEKLLHLDSVTIYPQEWFYPFPAKARYSKNYIEYATENTYAIHLWIASWAKIPAFKLIRQQHYARGLATMLKEVLKGEGASIKYYRKIASSFKQALSTSDNK
ncbi:glycosyltransferase family 32 protein [Winogradskyella sp. A3E31]|uniref:glycosyltransferase family 32 protein n=1 Tax=Winogradskyella sp. A3E31 TaxID=3349637 RepID=UPI00398AFF88